MKTTPWPTLSGGSGPSISAGGFDEGIASDFVGGVVDTYAENSVEGLSVAVVLNGDNRGPAIEAMSVGIVGQTDGQTGPAVEAIAVAVILVAA